MSAPSAPPVELWGRDEGEGPAIVLLHGVGANHTLWNAVIPDLVGSFRVVAPDLRGHGRTPAPPGSEMTFDELARDVLGLLDAKGVPTAHLVGMSGGAFLALRMALDRPDRVKSLTMVSGAAYCDNHTRSVAERWIETYTKEGADPFALRLLKDVYYPDWIEEHLDFADQVRAEVARTDYGPAVRWSRAMMKFDERNRIASVARPTLIIQAMDDQVVDASHGRILRQSILDAQIRIFAETGHMIPIERPSETAAAVGKFVREVEARAPA
jgi:3-oxoadipate enol-lactonase